MALRISIAFVDRFKSDRTGSFYGVVTVRDTVRCALSGAHLIFLPHKGDTMKKLVILVLTIVTAMCFVFSACFDNSGTTTGGNTG